jgi:hypothetical protein
MRTHVHSGTLWSLRSGILTLVERGAGLSTYSLARRSAMMGEGSDTQIQPGNPKCTDDRGHQVEEPEDSANDDKDSSHKPLTPGTVQEQPSSTTVLAQDPSV